MFGKVVYVMSGRAHLPYLLVSLMTLRRHWDGDVAVYAWPDLGRHQGCWNIVKYMATDRRLDFEPICWEPEHRKRNAQFECKQRVMMSLACDRAVYIDADTIIAGSIKPLFDALENRSFVATQFCDWVTNSGTIKKRICRLRPFLEIDQDLITEVTEREWPSVNGGIFACRPDSAVLPLWHKWTKIARPIFISDESVLHIMLPRFCNELGVMLGGAWNCSPKYQPKDFPDEAVRIWHFHGDSNVRPKKSKKGVELWMPEFHKATKGNFGRWNDWQNMFTNKYMAELGIAE